MDDNENGLAESRRIRLMGIVTNKFARDNVAVMQAIKEQTGQDVSVRSIQCWLIDPRRPSHRTMPEWVLRGLEDFIARPDKQEELKRIADRVERRRAEPMRFDYSDEVWHSRAVEMATNEIEWEERERSRWREQFGVAAGAMLADEFRAMRREMSSMSNALGSITRALHMCDNFEDFRRHADDSIRDASVTAFHVRETRNAFQNATEEFGHPEGLPDAQIKN